MPVQIDQGCVKIYRNRDAAAFNADLLELLELPNLISCHTISLWWETELNLETVLAMFNTSLAQTLKVLECQEIYFSPQTLEQLLEFELESLTLSGGSSSEYPVGETSFPTLEAAHLAVLRSHPRLRQLKKLYLPNQYLERDTI